MCDLSWLHRDMDEAPSWKIFPKAHAAPRRGCWCSLAAIWSQMWDQVPGKEPVTQTGAGHNAGSSSSKGSSRHNSQTRNFSSRMSKYFALQRQKKMYFTWGFTRTLYFLRNFGYSNFSFLMKAKEQWLLFLRVRKSDRLLPAEQQPESTYKQESREMFLLSCFPLSYVTPLLVASCR